MARPRKTVTAASDKRAQLMKLVDELSADQEAAIKEAEKYFSGPQMQHHLTALATYQKSALPNDVFDTFLKNNITVVQSTQEWLTGLVNRPEVETATMQP